MSWHTISTSVKVISFSLLSFINRCHVITYTNIKFLSHIQLYFYFSFSALCVWDNFTSSFKIKYKSYACTKICIFLVLLYLTIPPALCPMTVFNQMAPGAVDLVQIRPSWGTGTRPQSQGGGLESRSLPLACNNLMRSL